MIFHTFWAVYIPCRFSPMGYVASQKLYIISPIWTYKLDVAISCFLWSGERWVGFAPLTSSQGSPLSVGSGHEPFEKKSGRPVEPVITGRRAASPLAGRRNFRNTQKPWWAKMQRRSFSVTKGRFIFDKAPYVHITHYIIHARLSYTHTKYYIILYPVYNLWTFLYTHTHTSFRNVWCSDVVSVNYIISTQEELKLATWAVEWHLRCLLPYLRQWLC